MKKLIYMIIYISFVLAACSTNEQEENLKPAEMNPEELPEAPAFEDEFTREFLQSVEALRKGYYPFLSKSKSFTMDFPEDMEIEQRSHIVGPENRSETVEIRNADKSLDVHVSYYFHYTNFMLDAETSKDEMSKSADQDLDFKRVETKQSGQNLDIAEFQYDNSSHSILGLVWNDNHQEIQVFVSIRCMDLTEKEQCKTFAQEDREKVIEQLKSVELISQENE